MQGTLFLCRTVLSGCIEVLVFVRVLDVVDSCDH